MKNPQQQAKGKIEGAFMSFFFAGIFAKSVQIESKNNYKG
jgi:hypothetical protein